MLFEKYTQEIYQQLLNTDFGNVKTVEVLHNVKLRGRSGQEHQIDVYWEYEIAGFRHKVAIKCKNYKQLIRCSIFTSLIISVHSF